MMLCVWGCGFRFAFCFEGVVVPCMVSILGSSAPGASLWMFAVVGIDLLAFLPGIFSIARALSWRCSVFSCSVFIGYGFSLCVCVCLFPGLFPVGFSSWFLYLDFSALLGLILSSRGSFSLYPCLSLLGVSGWS